MPVTVHWGDPDETHLLVTYYTPMTADEILAAEHRINHLLDAQQPPANTRLVHCVIDTRYFNYFEGITYNVVEMAAMLDQLRHPRRGVDIGVAVVYAVQTAFTLLGKTGNRSAGTMHFCKTMEEAHALVAALNQPKSDAVDEC